MEKIMILLYSNGDVCSVLHIAVPDGEPEDRLAETLSAAEHDWNTTEKGLETDYDAFILKYLTDSNYKVRQEENFEVYRTCL